MMIQEVKKQFEKFNQYGPGLIYYYDSKGDKPNGALSHNRPMLIISTRGADKRGAYCLPITSRNPDHNNSHKAKYKLPFNGYVSIQHILHIPWNRLTQFGGVMEKEDFDAIRKILIATMFDKDIIRSTLEDYDTHCNGCSFLYENTHVETIEEITTPIVEEKRSKLPIDPPNTTTSPTVYRVEIEEYDTKSTDTAMIKTIEKWKSLLISTEDTKLSISSKKIYSVCTQNRSVSFINGLYAMYILEPSDTDLVYVGMTRKSFITLKSTIKRILKFAIEDTYEEVKKGTINIERLTDLDLIMVAIYDPELIPDEYLRQRLHITI